MPTLRKKHDLLSMVLELDMLEEKLKVFTMRTIDYQQHVASSCNKNIYDGHFKKWELVLIKLFENIKNP